MLAVCVHSVFKNIFQLRTTQVFSSEGFCHLFARRRFLGCYRVLMASWRTAALFLFVCLFSTRRECAACMKRLITLTSSRSKVCWLLSQSGDLLKCPDYVRMCWETHEESRTLSCPCAVITSQPVHVSLLAGCALVAKRSWAGKNHTHTDLLHKPRVSTPRKK